MALYFGKRRPLSRTTQYILAFIGLLLGLAVMISWLTIRMRQTAPTDQTEESDPSAMYVEPPTDVGHALLILDTDKRDYFLLVKTDPVEQHILVSALPTTMAAEDTTLQKLWKKHGPIRATQAVADTLDLPINHYIQFSESGLVEFLNHLENEITITLPERVSTRDENGAPIRLSAGKNKLAAQQTAAVIRYTGWKQKQNATKTVTALVTAVFNQYLLPDTTFNGYFAALANTAQTDLRIDHYNAYKDALTHLAAKNTGEICRVVALEGTTENSRYIPDVKSMKRKSPLY